MLTYKNDPLLFDGETANELIRGRKTNMILLDKRALNLYSAFTKKSDFIEKGKMVQPLQKTAYAKISNRLLEQIKNKYDKRELIKRIESYTCKRTNRKAINKWFKKKALVLQISPSLPPISAFLKFPGT